MLHATDSLRQVANRSLMRARATRSAATQVDAMKPFVRARKRQDGVARGLVTSCVAQALHRFGDSLGNGWEPVLDVLETTYGDEGRGDGDATIAAEAEASCRAALRRADASLDREPVAEGDEDEDLDLGVPVECVERAVRLMVLVARDRRRRRDRDGDEGRGRAARRAVDVARVSIETRIWRRRQRVDDGDMVRDVRCVGELARDDDDAIDALFALLDDDESGACAKTWARRGAARSRRRLRPPWTPRVRVDSSPRASSPSFAIVARRTRRYYRRCGRCARALRSTPLGGRAARRIGASRDRRRRRSR